MASRLNPWKIQGYKPGQNVVCKIAKAEPGGYAVMITKDNLPGYLPSNARHNVGDEVLATFVCIDKNRVLLSERFTHGKGDLTKKNYGTPDWSEHLNELDPGFQTGAQSPVQDDGSNQYLTGPLPAQGVGDPYQSGLHNQQYATGPLPQQYSQQPNQQQYATGPLPAQIPQDQMLSGQQQPPDAWNAAPAGAPPQNDQWNGTQQEQWDPQGQEQWDPQTQQQQMEQWSAAAQQTTLPPPGPPEQYLSGAQPAQRYADGVPTRRFQLRRAIDLIMPPIEADSMRSMRIGDFDVEWLITQLEGGMHTGCVKAACESRLSRAAMLLYKGRAVGCIYGCKSDPTTKPTEESLQAMLADLESPDTVVTIYDLPEEITLAMSSLFLGYPVERHDDYSAKEYLDYICNWLGQKNGTATLAISLTQDRGTCLGYIYKGEFSGAFYVEDQAYRADRAFVDDLLGNDPRAALEVSILPPEMHASAVRFGFSLSMARTRKLE